MRTGLSNLVTDARSKKARQITRNPSVRFCSQGFRFYVQASNIGHPLKPENAALRAALTEAFAEWYFRHNDEKNEDLCYIRAKLTSGFFYCGGTGYKIDFVGKSAESFPFEFDAVLPSSL